MKSRSPLTRVQVIERSIRCFVSGLLGLLPVIGLPFAVAAIVNYVRVSRHQGAEWNPAQRYLRWGVVYAVLGTIVTLILVLLVAQALPRN